MLTTLTRYFNAGSYAT